MERSQIDAFITDDTSTIQSLYKAHRATFIGFGKKYNLSSETLADIYQDAFVALRKQALQGNLYKVKSSLRTYLFGIGKFMIYNELKRQQRFSSYIENTVHEAIIIVEISENKTLTLEQQLLRTHFEQLGKKCQEMLTMFYYRGLTISDIVATTSYESENVVRSQKSRCLKTLKEAIKAHKNE